jgi:hypothetical protein
MKPRYEAMIRFIEDINEPNFQQDILAKVKPYEIDGWAACLSGPFRPFKMKVEGKYQVIFLRKSDK